MPARPRPAVHKHRHKVVLDLMLARPHGLHLGPGRHEAMVELGDLGLGAVGLGAQSVHELGGDVRVERGHVVVQAEGFRHFVVAEGVADEAEGVGDGEGLGLAANSGSRVATLWYNAGRRLAAARLSGSARSPYDSSTHAAAAASASYSLYTQYSSHASPDPRPP